MTIALANYEDAHMGGIRDLWKEAFPNNPPRNWAERSIPEKLRFQPEFIIVALDGERVVGSVMAGYDGHRGWLYSVAVLRSHRRRGVGSALVGEAERRLRRLGCVKINLQIRTANAGTADFYRALGYAVEDRVSMGKAIVKDDGEETQLRQV